MLADKVEKYEVQKLDDEEQKYHPMELPRIVLSNAGAVEWAGRVARRLGLSGPAMCICDDTTLDIAGWKVSESLSSVGIGCDVITIKDATDEEVARVVDALRDGNAAFAVGIGGGKPIDVAKLASHKTGIPYLSVPTAASHDGIVSSRASILSNGVKRSYDARTPLALIGDTEIIAKAPPRLMAAGCGDIISNITAVLDWELAHRLKNEPISSYAISLSRMSAQIIIENASKIKPGHEPSARILIKSLVSSGVAMSIAGSSRPASGSEHLFSHALDMIAPKPALHGEQCGIGTIMMMYLHGGDWKAVKYALKMVGAPTTAEEIGIEEDLIVKALVKAQHLRPERYTILSGGLTECAARNLAIKTGVIKGEDNGDSGD